MYIPCEAFKDFISAACFTRKVKTFNAWLLKIQKNQLDQLCMIP